jgi:hypothetical protein
VGNGAQLSREENSVPATPIIFSQLLTRHGFSGLSFKKNLLFIPDQLPVMIKSLHKTELKKR